MASLLQPKRERTICCVNNKATFDQRMRYVHFLFAVLLYFLEFIQHIGVKIGYGKVILFTCRLVQKMENWGEDWIWHVKI